MGYLSLSVPAAITQMVLDEKKGEGAGMMKFLARAVFLVHTWPPFYMVERDTLGLFLVYKDTRSI